MAEAEAQQEVESVHDSVRAAVEAVAAEEMAAQAPVEEPVEAELEAEEAPQEPQGEPEAAEEAALEGEDAAPAEEEHEEPEEVILAPASWSKEDREVFDKLGSLEGDAAEVARKALEVVARRETERDKLLSKNAQESGPLKAVVEEFGDYFRQIGVTPEQSFRGLVAAEQSLRFGTPQQKVEALQHIARSYGIEMPSQQPANGQAQDDAFVDPDLARIQSQMDERFGRFEAMLTENQQAQQAAKETEAKTTAQRFFDRLEGANPKELPEARYVNEVLPQLQVLVQAEPRDAGPPDADRLMELYRNAAWSIPGVRERVQQDMAQAQKAAEKKVVRTVRKESSSPAGGAGLSAHSEEAPLDESVDATIRRSMNQLAKAAGGLR